MKTATKCGGLKVRVKKKGPEITRPLALKTCWAARLIWQLTCAFIKALSLIQCLGKPKRFVVNEIFGHKCTSVVFRQVGSSS